MPHGSSKKRHLQHRSPRRKPPVYGAKPSSDSRPPIGEKLVQETQRIGASVPPQAVQKFNQRYGGATFGKK